MNACATLRRTDAVVRLSCRQDEEAICFSSTDSGPGMPKIAQGCPFPLRDNDNQADAGVPDWELFLLFQTLSSASTEPYPSRWRRRRRNNHMPFPSQRPALPRDRGRVSLDSEQAPIRVDWCNPEATSSPSLRMFSLARQTGGCAVVISAI